MMFFPGAIIGLILVVVGWPLSIYPFIIAQAAESHLRQGLLLAIGAGFIIDLMTFQTWPKMTSIYIISTLFGHWLFNRIVIKHHQVTVMIILVMTGLTLSFGYYLTDLTQGIFSSMWLVIVNTLLGLVWLYLINFFSNGQFIQSISTSWPGEFRR